MKARTLIAALLLTGISYAQQYSKVKIFTDQDGLKELASLGVAVDHGIQKKGVFFISDFSEAEIAIIEMGTNQPGDIQELVEIAMPDLGLITNIGSAHLERLGSVAGIREEKGALFRQVMKKSLLPEGLFR